MTDLSWIDSFSNSGAGVYPIQQCITSGDVFCEGANRILMLTFDMNLICLDGDKVTHEARLQDTPSSLAVHYSSTVGGLTPLVAVGYHDTVMFFLNFTHYGTFTIPRPYPTDDEERIIRLMKSGTIDIAKAQSALASLKRAKQRLTKPSERLVRAKLRTQSQVLKLKSAFRDPNAGNSVTCLISLKINADHESKATKLLIGTESGQLILLNIHDDKPDYVWYFTGGLLTLKGIGYTAGRSIVVTVCTDMRMVIIRDLNPRVSVIKLQSFPVDVAISNQMIYVPQISKNVAVYDFAGKFKGTVSFEDDILGVQKVKAQTEAIQICAVATKDTIYFIDETRILQKMRIDSGIMGIYYGKIGREPNGLLIVSPNGGLSMKTISRNRVKSKMPVKKEDYYDPIPVRKKGELFAEQSKFELVDTEDMYKSWKNTLRTLTALLASEFERGFYNSIITPDEDIIITSKVEGYGPIFFVRVFFTYTGRRAVDGVLITPKFSKDYYKVEPLLIPLPTVIGGYQYTATFKVTNIEEHGLASTIYIITTTKRYTVPLSIITIEMPISQYTLEHTQAP